MKHKHTHTFISLLIILNSWIAFSQQEFDSLLRRELIVENPVYKPVVGFGAGITNFYGDVHNNYLNPMVGRYAFRANVSTFLEKQKRSLVGNFHIIYGSLTANQIDLDDPRLNLNFLSEIIVFGLDVEYNFAHFFSNPEPVLRPFVSVGIENMSFDSKADLRCTEDGASWDYHYWPDGTIRNIPWTRRNQEPNLTLVRDWKYESDLRDYTASRGFERYGKNTFAIPVDLGVDFFVSARVKMRLGASLHMTFTDCLDNVRWRESGTKSTPVEGDFANDRYSFTYLTMYLDLFSEPRVITEELMFAELDEFDYDLLSDEDGDGVFDLSDECPGTPRGVEVDTLGCPHDDDNDGVPDYMDRQRDTPRGAIVDDEGAEISEDKLIALFNFPEAVPRSQLALYLEGTSAGQERMTLADMPGKYHELDLDGDGYMSFQEMLSGIDAFFDFKSDLTTREVYTLINFFFRQ